MEKPSPGDLRRIFDETVPGTAHPDESVLRTYPVRDQAVESHLFLCRPCRETLVRIHRARRRAYLSWAAAASLLLAAFLAWRPAQDPFPGPASGIATGPLAGAPLLLSPAEMKGEGEALIGGSILVTSGPGTLLLRGREAWSLERGGLLAETAGEGFTLRAKGLEITLLEGALSVDAPREEGLAALLSSAWAEEGVVQVTLHRGRCRLRTPAETREVSEPSGWAWDGASLLPAAPRPLASRWTALEAGGPVRESRRILLPAPGEAAYVLEVLVRKRDAGAEAAAVFEAAGKGWELPLGGDLLPAGDAWRRLRISAGPDGCRVVLGSLEAVAGTAGTLPGRLPPLPRAGVGLRAWGGEIEFGAARWRPEP